MADNFGYGDILQTLVSHEQGLSLVESVENPNESRDSLRIWELSPELEVQSQSGMELEDVLLAEYYPSVPLHLARVPGSGYVLSFSHPVAGFIRTWRIDEAATQLNEFGFGVEDENKAGDIQVVGTDMYLLNTIPFSGSAMISLARVADWIE